MFRDQIYMREYQKTLKTCVVYIEKSAINRLLDIPKEQPLAKILLILLVLKPSFDFPRNQKSPEMPGINSSSDYLKPVKE